MIVLALLVVLGPWVFAHIASLGRIKSVDNAPARDVAIVLGAGVRYGQPSPYLRARLDIAHQLYEKGQIRAILVSGDNRQSDYNEPDAMRNYLIDKGIPASQVVADYAGVNTHATCVRAKEIFGVSEGLIISQSYHLPRAVTTCRLVGVNAIGVGDDSRAKDATWRDYAIREIPASMKMVIDVLTDRKPILGEREPGIDEALR